jgi:hypothetical protein
MPVSYRQSPRPVSTFSRSRHTVLETNYGMAVDQDWFFKPLFPPNEDASCSCICVKEPDLCKIDIEWHGMVAKAHRGYMKSRAFDPVVNMDVETGWFGVAVMVKLRHLGNKSVAGCHLHQSIQSGQTWEDGSFIEKNVPDDYTRNTKDIYGATWLWDTPWRVYTPRLTGTYPKTMTYWFQATDFVEEAPIVKNWFGFASTVFWREPTHPKHGFQRWKDLLREPFAPMVTEPNE